MVRAAATRSAKYDAKLRGSVWNTRFTDLKNIMVEQTNKRYAEQAFYENKMKAYMEAIGMYGIQQHNYMNYGFRLWALSRTFSMETLRMEAVEEANKWLRRGCLAQHLIGIARLFGINLTGWP